jgi:thymidylate synthase
MYQRSCDVGLGVPFNIASYALLTYMLAQVTGLKPKEFIHILGDTHIYLNHIDALREQIKNEPKTFPKLFLDPSVTNIDNFTFESFKLENYESHKSINMNMAV